MIDPNLGRCPFPKRYPSELCRDAAYYMRLAFNEAINAWNRGEVPIGAVVELGGEVVASAHNQVETLKDPTAHAEILAITQAAAAVGDWRLEGATLYVTKEPCPMCAGASVMSRLTAVCYGVGDAKMGFLGGAAATHLVPGLNHKLVVLSGVLEDECREILRAFFQARRSASDAGPEQRAAN